MNPVDAVAFKERKATREGGNDHIENDEMEILTEGNLDKVLIFPKKHTDDKQPQNKIYAVIDNGYFEQYDVKFPKEFVTKRDTYYNV